MDETASKKVTEARLAAAAKAAADKAAADKAAADKAAADKAAQDAAAAEAARQQAAAAAAASAAVAKIPAPVQQAPAAASGCDPNYSGACVPIASDVDCAGGSGNGPAYVRGPVTVIGRDIYGLDSDGNGIGCER
jgi:membrane protein involved in colicin uptake